MKKPKVYKWILEIKLRLWREFRAEWMRRCKLTANMKHPDGIVGFGEFADGQVKEIEPNRVYTFDEALELLQLSPTTLRKFVKNGEIPATKLGGQWRFLGNNLIGIFRPLGT